MNFGTPTLTTPRASVRTGRRLDCGRYGKLTAKEIARIAGITYAGVWRRVRHGVKGAELCAPKHESGRHAKEKCSKPVVSIAVKLARAFPHKVPTLREIQRTHPMCERNAMRWRQAFADVAGAA